MSLDKIMDINQLSGRVCINNLLNMFDLVPDVLFWVKNIDAELIYANQVLLKRLQVKDLKSLKGRTDYDFSPEHIARQFMTDDKKVMGGEVINERLEINLSKNGEVAWYITSKHPLIDEEGCIIGTYGMSRHLEKTSVALSSIQPIEAPVEYIRQHFADDITLTQLAQVSCLSISALERRFKKYLHKTPKQFINEVRLENARRMLIETNLPISVIAVESGYSDHSYFSKQFSAFFSISPSGLRESL